MTTEPYDLSDDQWSAIADYVSNQATPAAATAMREQLATDPALAAQVTPILALWDLLSPNRLAAHLLANTPKPLAGEPAPGNAADRDAVRTTVAWARLEAALVPSLAKPLARPSTADTLQIPRQSPSIHQRATPLAVRPVDTRTSWWRRPWVITAGIACLLLLGAGVVFHVQYPAFQYQGGTTGRVVTLPDHSVATLAPGAYLGTSHYYTSGIRAVYLFGQAHFHVAPDPAHPFVVHVVGVDATVLGTTFGMTSDTFPHVAVEVTQGKIALIVLGKDGTRHPVAVLTAGQVQQIPALTQWMTEAGAILGAAGVPFTTSIQVHNAMMRATAALATPHE